MPFDMAFNARGTAGYVTDPSYGVPLLSETYPHTYTAANGYSVNAGWVGGLPGNFLDRASGNDPRIAGINYIPNDNRTASFKVDLASGSAPGAGSYIIDSAMGDPLGGQKVYWKVLDNTTVLIDGSNGGAGYAPATGHYLDATFVDRTATTTWNGATSAKTFASTTAFFNLGPLGVGDSNTMAHFRLTLVVTPTPGPITQLLMPPMRAA